MTVTVTEPISVTPTTVTMGMYAGEAYTEQITLTNEGAGEIPVELQSTVTALPPERWRSHSRKMSL